ncbi:MAG: hypothetical protein IPP15_14305 [Saprospiraceae bacterium]|uniref:Uncharacterized protein n=1 Tax=Candidatus Opimibacter skivensis TaxID=2982028 RepID=A0A9D7SUI9_9BACT|nr:hypothetical protein [Candidatus Opimibacter skivensis]
MEEKELLELIDQYLLGRIKPDDLQRLEYLRKTNPDTELQVRQSIEAFNVIKYLRYKQLREKLRQIDNADEKSKTGFFGQRWLVMTILIILSFLGLWLWAIRHYDPASIAMRHFLKSSEINMMLYETKDVSVNDWTLANIAFRNKNFQEAIILFQPFLEDSLTETSTAAKWNILLSRFALGDTDIYWKEEMIVFQSTASEPYKSEALKLLQTLNSPFYKIFVLHLSPQLSALKPRLM